MYMQTNILKLKNNKKHKGNKNRGGECKSWKTSTSPPRSTYSDVVLTGILAKIDYRSCVCGRMN